MVKINGRDKQFEYAEKFTAISCLPSMYTPFDLNASIWRTQNEDHPDNTTFVIKEGSPFVYL